MMFPKKPRIKNKNALKDYAEKHFRCEVCGTYQNLDAPHHIIYKSQLGDDHEDNLITLCRSCHNKAHKKILTEDYLFAVKRFGKE